MKNSRFSEGQIIGFFGPEQGMPVKELCRLRGARRLLPNLASARVSRQRFSWNIQCLGLRH